MKTFLYQYNQGDLKKDIQANHGRLYQQCSLGVMDTIADPNITFDKDGICNYYHQYFAAAKGIIAGEEGKEWLQKKMNQISYEGKSKKYDCIIGLSGGVDSTYLCLMAKEYNLRPLIVHFDNGWNSELAVYNIEHVVKTLNYDLYTYVVHWDQFRELQLSYLKASVVDIEVLTDHAFMAILYSQARKWNIKYVLAGMNIATESILPSYWIYWKGDAVNIRDIQKKHGTLSLGKLKSYPFLDYSTKKYCREVLKMEVVTPLNYMLYQYNDVKRIITDQLGWRDYGGKHHESVWTRFYQGYILPNKFHIDKRKAHLSNLIFSGQLTRNQALTILENPPYDLRKMEEDYNFVLKKFGLTEEQFTAIMEKPRVEHTSFKVQKGLREKFAWLPFLRKKPS